MRKKYLLQSIFLALCILNTSVECNTQETCILKSSKNNKNENDESKTDSCKPFDEQINKKTLEFINFFMAQNPRVFFDAAASYPISQPAAIEMIKNMFLYGNSTGSNESAFMLKNIENKVAKAMAMEINCDFIDAEKNPNCIIFTPGATLGNNIIISGILEFFVKYNNNIEKLKTKTKSTKKKINLIKKNHIITTSIEHKSVLSVIKRYESLGFNVTYLDPDKHGYIEPNKIEKAIKPNTCLVSIHAVNNEIGTVQNLYEIGKICSKRKVIFHTDATQAFGKIKIDVKEYNIDAITMSGHKIGTMKGIGFIYLNKDLTGNSQQTAKIGKCEPILFGGGNVYCPGSRSTALIASLVPALQHIKQKQQQIHEYFEYLIAQLQRIPQIEFYTDVNTNVKSIVFFKVKDAFQKDIINIFKKTFDISAGSSCSSDKKSHVLERIDPKLTINDGVIRMSLHEHITKENIDDFIKNLHKLAKPIDYTPNDDNNNEMSVNAQGNSNIDNKSYTAVNDNSDYV